MIRTCKIDELPKYSPWVRRLLNLDHFPIPTRNTAKIDEEFDKDKYGKLLQYHTTYPHTSIEELRLRGVLGVEEVICISENNNLFLETPAATYNLQDEATVNSLRDAIRNTETVVELGCGFGYNLSMLKKRFPGRRWIGGEYSPNAVALAGRLFHDQQDILVQTFNWYDTTWPILDTIRGKAVVFTLHSIEQLPKCKDVIQTFWKYQKRISQVVHLEPIYELENGMSTLSLMRQAYTIINDYNTDLLGTLKQTKAVITRIEHDIVGVNPLNPTSAIHWVFP